MLTKSKKIEKLYQALLSLKNIDEANRFLRDLFTAGEIDEFANRWQAAQMLDRGVSYTEIEQATGLSSATIARISKWLQKGEGGYRLILRRTKGS